MYVGGSYSYGENDKRKKKKKGADKRNRRKKICIFASFSFLAGCIGGVFLILTIKVLAAPENGTPETGANMKESILLIDETVSGNTPAPEVTTQEPAPPVVVIDPGHGGDDEGCAREGVQEKEINLKIAVLVRDKLGEMGYRVIMAREDDTYIAKEKRVELANNYPADIYVSIHQNISEEESVNGIETWYDGSDGQRDSKRLAQLVQQETLKTTGAMERELQNDQALHVTGKTTMPACLIETGFLSNAQERAKLVSEEYQDQVAAGIVRGIDLYFNPMTMYLTFDDGPSKENTVRVLDTLKEKNVKATFFVVGENVRRYPEIAKRIVDEGHTIGVHCDNHNYDTLYASVDSYLKDFEKAFETVYDVTGVEVKLYRFPGGSVNPYNKAVAAEIVKEMTARGYIYFDWNASLEDAVSQSDPEELLANARETTLGRKKIVMLAHDVIYNTSISLGDLIDRFPDYEMKPLTMEVTPIQFNQD